MYRNSKLLKAVAQMPCMRCGLHGSTQASHSNQLIDGKGMGIKAHDYRIAALCMHCHAQIDQGRDLSKDEKKHIWDDAHRKTIGKLFEDGWLEVQDHPH